MKTGLSNLRRIKLVREQLFLSLSIHQPLLVCSEIWVIGSVSPFQPQRPLALGIPWEVFTDSFEPVMAQICLNPSFIVVVLF